MEIPAKGMPKERLFRELEALRIHDLDWHSGKAFTYVFDPGPAAMEVGNAAYAMFLSENALDFTAFPSLFQLETDLVDMARRHVRGDEQVVGNFTSGGTESIILAVKAARDYFRSQKPQIRQPEMILPVTAHARLQSLSGPHPSSINASNVDWVDDFLSDLEACVQKAKGVVSKGLPASVKENLSTLDASCLGDATFSQMLTMAGIQEGKLPERMGDVNEILNALPPEVREGLFIEYVNSLFRSRHEGR